MKFDINSPEWISLTSLMITTFGTKCMMCGNDEGSADVDHIAVKSVHKDLQYELLNLGVLCKTCNRDIKKAKPEYDCVDYRSDVVIDRLKQMKKAGVDKQVLKYKKYNTDTLIMQVRIARIVDGPNREFYYELYRSMFPGKQHLFKVREPKYQNALKDLSDIKEGDYLWVEVSNIKPFIKTKAYKEYVWSNYHILDREILDRDYDIRRDITIRNKALPGEIQQMIFDGDINTTEELNVVLKHFNEETGEILWQKQNKSL